jgi:sterol desaturase/sphingolipid hydroxylase (fatty acid hydroxylase superfamily)
MKFNLIALAIPFFLLFIALEYLAARRKRLSHFHLQDTVANLSIGIAERLLDVYTTVLFYSLYDHLQKNYGLFHIRPSLLLWILLLLCTDGLWYWYHRLAHEINIFWAVHVVHHQSEDFNYTVSARITVFQAVVRTGFWAVLPLLGFPAPMIVSMLLIHGLYPFFIHTKLVGKLGILEYIFVTPSHHRVHHASNERYLDKNYGDMFIIWDKLFGTFQQEDGKEEIVYGLTKPLKSHSFLWQHFHFVIELFFAVRAQKSWWNKLKILVSRPAAIDPAMRDKAEAAFNIFSIDRPVGKPLNRYVKWQMCIVLGILFVFILLGRNIALTQQILVACIILITLVNCGAIMEQKTWIVYLEFSRLLLVLLGIGLCFPAGWLALLLIGIAYLIYYYLRDLQPQYLKLVYANPTAH